MSDNRIKVVGYAQRVFYNDGIEYRNFSDDLVGTQLASNGGTSLFTIGNFSISTNLDDKISKLFYTSNFSDFYNLKNLNLSSDDIEALLTETNKIKLNLDKTVLTNYALFGSLTEFIRVSLENIIINWPASIFVSPIDEINVLSLFPTVEDYSYNGVNGISSFKISTNRFKNDFGINFLKNGNITNTFTNTNDLRNLTVNYSNYVISNSNGEFKIIDFSGSSTILNDYVYFTVEGDVFKNYNNFNIDYHIKPNSTYVNKFFKTLNDFESYILNRFSSPIYTSTFKYELLSETGNLILSERSLTWPINDGYNLDFQSDAYINFVGELLEISQNSDLVKTNLMHRFLVSESISEFDTLPTFNNEDFTSGQKITSLLKIYGREFDEIKRYIDGISFANVVSYDKKDNVPDALVKNLARVLGWDVTSSILEIDLINNYLSVNNSSYSGHSVSLSPIEAEVELWRRLILNSPWLWKSKGTRKGIEFLFKFIGAPNGLITFNEFVYIAENSMNMTFFNSVLEELTDSTSIDGLNIDRDGFPLIQPDSPEMYFQKAGLWYRETGGVNSKEDILIGNNPHIGPYDGGQEYINQFKNLIPNFEPITLVNEERFTVSDNLFTNYDNGEFNGIFNNDTVVSFNLIDWLNNLNTNINNLLTEDFVNYPIQPNMSTCVGTINLQMNSYLDNNIFYNELVSGIVFSSGTIVDSATTLNIFTSYLDNVVTSLNTGNATSLIGVYNDNNYQVIEDIVKCGNNSFYLDKEIDITFDVNFNYTCEGGDCNPNSLEISGIDSDSGLVIFNNVLNNTVPSAECCTNLGFNATSVNGGFNCYSKVNIITCSDYTPAKVDNNNYIIFVGPEGGTYYVPSAQCCPIGSNAIPNLDNTLFKCLMTVSVSVCDEYIPSSTYKDLILFSTPSGDTFTIPNSGCCPTNTTAIDLGYGGFNCQINYYDYTGYTIVDGVAIFDNGVTTFTEMPKCDCCPVGTIPKIALSEGGQTVYICEEPTPHITLLANSALLPQINPSCIGNVISFSGSPGHVVRYRVRVNNNGNQGFTSTMISDNNINYPIIGNGVKPAIIIPQDGEIKLTWELCARKALRPQPNCVDVDIIFSYNGIDILTVNSYVCN